MTSLVVAPESLVFSPDSLVQKHILDSAFAPCPFSSSLLSWKCTRPGARAHVTAQACLTTLDLPLVGAFTTDAVTIYDWASRAPGAGRELYLTVIEGKTLISIGGSKKSIHVKDRIGLPRAGAVGVYEYERYPLLGSNLLSVVRYCRGVWRKAHEPACMMSSVAGTVDPGYTTAPFSPRVRSVLDFVPTRFARVRKSMSNVMALLSCPERDPVGVIIQDGNGDPRGYAIITCRDRDHAEIIDIFVASDAVADWAFAVRAVLRSICTRKVRCVASASIVRTALLANGFRLSFELPVYSRKRDLPVNDIHLTAADGDLFLV